MLDYADASMLDWLGGNSGWVFKDGATQRMDQLLYRWAFAGKEKRKEKPTEHRGGMKTKNEIANAN